jgi:hypothetical protein
LFSSKNHLFYFFAWEKQKKKKKNYLHGVGYLNKSTWGAPPPPPPPIGTGIGATNHYAFDPFGHSFFFCLKK